MGYYPTYPLKQAYMRLKICQTSVFTKNLSVSLSSLNYHIMYHFLDPWNATHSWLGWGRMISLTRHLRFWRVYPDWLTGHIDRDVLWSIICSHSRHSLKRSYLYWCFWYWYWQKHFMMYMFRLTFLTIWGTDQSPHGKVFCPVQRVITI